MSVDIKKYSSYFRLDNIVDSDPKKHLKIIFFNFSNLTANFRTQILGVENLEAENSDKILFKYFFGPLFNSTILPRLIYLFTFHIIFV